MSNTMRAQLDVIEKRLETLRRTPMLAKVVPAEALLESAMALIRDMVGRIEHLEIEVKTLKERNTHGN